MYVPCESAVRHHQGSFTRRESGRESEFFLWSLSLLKVNIKLNSLWTHLEAMPLSHHYKRTQRHIQTIQTPGLPLFLSRQIPWFSLTFPWFPKNFHRFFLSFHQDILVKKNPYLFFLNVALVTLVYANTAISWQLLRFNSLKKHFPQIYRFKRFENGSEKSSLIWNFFPWFWLKTPFPPDFPDWKKSSKFSLISLISGNPETRSTNTLSANILRTLHMTGR